MTALDHRPRRTTGTQTRRTVPWSVVLPIAVVLAGADGFWLVSLRGAVGAIERSQDPVSAWLLESALSIPAFVLAVLAALTLAARRFGAGARSRRALLGSGLLVAAATSVVGIAEVAISAVYDYHLQAMQMKAMDAMGAACNGSCLAQMEHATLAVHLHAIRFATWLILATNVVLVGWLVALRGGRLPTSAVRSARPIHRTRNDDVRLLLVGSLLAGAAMHAAGLSIVFTAVELALALALVQQAGRTTLRTCALVGLGALLLWAVSRTTGLPIGPETGVREAAGLADVVASLFEIVTVATSVLLLRNGERLRNCPALSAHGRSLLVAGVVAVTVLGLRGTDLPWLAGAASAVGMQM